jgi:hypothetical protein
MMQVQVNLKTVGNGSTSKFEMNVNATDTVGSVKDKVAASQLIAFPEHHLAVKGEKMAEQKKLSEYGVSAGSELEFVLEATEKSVVKQLSELLQSRDLTCDELGLLYCYKHGVSTNQALKTIGIDMKLADFVKDQKEFVVEGKKVSVVRSDTALKPVSVAQQLETILREQGPTMDITTLCSKFIQKFHVSVASIVQMRPVEFIQQNKQTFAMIGDGLVTLKECEDAELVFFVKGLPTEGHKKWLPPLLKSVQSVLTENLDAEMAATVECTETSVQVSMKNQVTVDLRFSPAFDSYASTVQALGASGPEARKPFEASFVKERTQFVAKQPGNVKVTIRLLKWWRDQQQWSCKLTRPSDYLIELIAIYAYQQCGKLSQSQMIANCMSIFARFDQLRVMWSNYYDQKDVWSPLMMQRPLLMDPVNPFSNIVDPQDFDSRELTQFASTTHFFW